ncbi:phage tail protein [Salmonella enterica subsp. enterica]|nr:phage tail protein [Salmonella enterica subsp. enterica serovar Reading]EDV4562384.1 phage tail protein [Salmonella enterica subsp. enterica]EEC0646649.1 phage tail protein [Salmonella enterica subsp. enterica]EEC5246881.1 phage tail protein [Salmonella enterica subsp. enterica]HAK8344116.1 phage tail protein [Salmonella enterica]
MPTRDERLTLTVGGVSHSDWTNVMADASFLTPAGAWEVMAGIENRTLPADVHEGARVILRAGRDILMTGLIDDVTEVVSRGQHLLTLSGRDNTAALVDCSAPVFTSQEMTLAEVMNQIVRPLGITRTAIRAGKSTAPRKFSVDPGESAWDALLRVAEGNGLWPWVEPDGTLVIGGPDYTAQPVATLTLRRDGTGNILSLTHHRSIAGRYSEVTVLAQGHGTDEQDAVHNRRGTARDAGFSLYRPLVRQMGDTDSDADATARARKLLTDSRLKGLTLTVVVRGIRTSDGIPWTPGQRVVLYSDSPVISGTFFLMARHIQGGRGRELVTTLTLKEDGIWIPDAYPHGKHKGKKPNQDQYWTDWRDIK